MSALTTHQGLRGRWKESLRLGEPRGWSVGSRSSALASGRVFWPTRAALLGLLRAAGFSAVFEHLDPSGVEETLPGRAPTDETAHALLIALRAEPCELGSSAPGAAADSLALLLGRRTLRGRTLVIGDVALDGGAGAEGELIRAPDMTAAPAGPFEDIVAGLVVEGASDLAGRLFALSAALRPGGTLGLVVTEGQAQSLTAASFLDLALDLTARELFPFRITGLHAPERGARDFIVRLTPAEPAEEAAILETILAARPLLDAAACWRPTPGDPDLAAPSSPRREDAQ